MLHPEDLERFRRMTPDERGRIGLDLLELALRFLQSLPPAEAQRRIELSREPWNPPEQDPVSR